MNESRGGEGRECGKRFRYFFFFAVRLEVIGPPRHPPPTPCDFLQNFLLIHHLSVLGASLLLLLLFSSSSARQNHKLYPLADRRRALTRISFGAGDKKQKERASAPARGIKTPFLSSFANLLLFSCGGDAAAAVHPFSHYFFARLSEFIFFARLFLALRSV